MLNEMLHLIWTPINSLQLDLSIFGVDEIDETPQRCSPDLNFDLVLLVLFTSTSSTTQRFGYSLSASSVADTRAALKREI